MKLISLKIENFKSHERTEISFRDELNCIVGPSGSGKSSVLDAIAVCFTGKCRLTDARGGGLRNLARNGDGRVRIEVVAMSPSGNEMTFLREYDSASNILKLNGAPVDNGQVEESLGLESSQLLALFDSKPLAEREAGELRGVFSNLLAPSKFADSFKRIGAPVPPDMDSLERLIKTTKEKELRDVKRDHKSAIAEVEAARKNLSEMSGKELDAAKIKSEINAKHAIKRQAYAYATAVAQLDQFKSNLKAMAGEKASIRLIEAELLNSQNDMRFQHETMAKLQGQLSELASTALSEPDSAYDACPLAVCPMKKKRPQSKTQPDAQTIKQKKDQAAMISKSIKALQADIQAANDKSSNLTAALALARQIDKINLPPAIKPVEDLDQAIAVLGNQLREAERIALLNRQLNDLQATAEKKRMEAERLENRVAGMIEIRDSIAATMGSLAGEVSRFCQPFIGQVTFDAAKMMFAPKIETRALSSGEQVILDAAVRCALAKHVGAGCVVVDHFNHLSDEEAKKMRGALMHTGQQILCIWAQNKKPEHIDNVSIHYFSKENGQTTAQTI